MNLFNKKNKDPFEPLKQHFLICSSLGVTTENCEMILKNSTFQNWEVGNVTSFNYGDPAIRYAKSFGRVDFAIIDNSLDGYKSANDVIHSLRNINPNIYIIKLTTTRDSLIDNEIANGFIDTYVLQPFQAAHLTKAIAGASRNREEEITL